MMKMMRKFLKKQNKSDLDELFNKTFNDLDKAINLANK